MPELPEVEVVRAGLARHVLGAVITSVEVLHPRPVRRDPRGPPGFATALTGRRIEDARRRGKYLWLPLDNGDALLGHLGMSGQFLLRPPESAPETHLRVRLALDGAADGRELRFVDQRMFGGSRSRPAAPSCRPRSRTSPATRSTRSSTTTRSSPRCAGASSGIKRQLLDQNLVSGVGNIYADEALWRARLHGERPGERLTAAQVRELLGHARDVMNEALGAGRHVVRRALRQRQRRVRLLRAVAARLRARGRALRPVRDADAPGRVHEPVVVLLPGLPAGPAAPPYGGPPRHRAQIDRRPREWDS